MSNEPTRHVLLNGVALPLARGSVPVQTNITQFPTPILIGPDPRLRQHNITSQVSLADFTGGAGRWRFRQTEEGVQRFWWSAGVDTRWPGRLCLAPKQVATALGSTGTPSPAGVIDATALETAGTWIACPGSTGPLQAGVACLHHGAYRIYPSGAFDATGADVWSGATAVPILGGTGQFQTHTQWFGRLITTLDNQSYPQTTSYCDNSGSLQSTGTFNPILLAGILDVLFGVESASYNGGFRLFSTTVSAGNVLNTWSYLATIPAANASEVGQALIAGTTGDGWLGLYLLTNFRIVQIDARTLSYGEIFRFQKAQPAGTYTFVAGQPFLEWERTRGLYTVVGDSDLVEITPGAARLIGPNQGDGVPSGETGITDAGLPSGYGGRINHVFASQRYLYAVLRGDAGRNQAPALLCYDTIGWHVIGTGAVGALWGRGIAWRNGVYVREKPAAGSGKVVQWYDPDSTQPPWQRASSERAFASSGSLYLPWFDAEQPTIDKLGVSVQVVVRNVPAGGAVRIAYQTAPGASWTFLDTLIDPSTGVLQPGNPSLTADGSYIYVLSTTGVVFRSIRFQVYLAGNGAATPVIEDLAFDFVPRPYVRYGWTVVVDAHTARDASGGYAGQTPAQINRYCRQMYESKQKVRFQYNDGGVDTYVLATGYNGPQTVDEREPTAQVTLTLLEV